MTRRRLSAPEVADLARRWRAASNRGDTYLTRRGWMTNDLNEYLPAIANRIAEAVADGVFDPDDLAGGQQ